MLIFHLGPTGVAQSPETMQENMGKWMTWVNKLRDTGKYVSGEPLIPGGKLISGNGGSTVTDGPYTEGKEVVGGFFIVNAADINEAVAMSKEYPDYDKGGSVQVRQVMRMDM